MKVFISGADGFLGSAVTAELARRGHEVVGLARDEAGMKRVQDAGGRCVRGDLFESGPWCAEIRDADKVISLTRPFRLDEDIPPEGMQEYGMKHAEAVTNLIKAAADGKAKAVITTYHTSCLGDRKGRWVESDAAAIDPVGWCRPLAGSFEAIEEIAGEAEVPLVRVYPAMVYGDGGWFRRIVDAFRSGRAKVVEPGDNFLSLIHVEDLAGLYALITERIDKDDVFILSDDRPVTQRDLLDHVAALMGKPKAPMVDLDAYAGQFGRLMAESMASSTRASGVKAIDTFDYELRHGGYEKGVEYTLKSMGLESGETVEEAA